MRGIQRGGELKSVLSNKGLGKRARKCLCEGVIVPTAFYRSRGMGNEKC